MRWLDQTAVVIASGPSLTADDAAYAREHATRVIVVNESWRMCRTADVLYAADSSWWIHRRPMRDDFAGERWTQDNQWDTKHPGRYGLSVIPARHGVTAPKRGAREIHTGYNSGFQAMSLAVVWGCRRVVFLGLDLSAQDGGPNHWHEDHPEPLRNSRAYPGFANAFNAAAPGILAQGVEVVNASRVTALKCFPRMTIQEALP